HFSDRSYEDYGQPQQARTSVTSEASVNTTISCIASMKIGDDRSAPVISQGLYTLQRVNSSRPHPN
ncbi:20740_t:CDS:1, partial [Gigaspora margarita]